MNHPPSRARSLWALIAEPRIVTVAVTTSHALVAIAGVAGLHAPPATMVIASGTATWLSAAWGLLLIVGGLLGVIGALPGWWYMERAGIIAQVAGLTMYVVPAAHLSITEPTGGRWAFTCLFAAGVGELVVRWLRISGPTLDPSRATPHLSLQGEDTTT